jgi:hypothetical protein
VLDGVSHVDLVAGKAKVLEGAVEELTRWADEDVTELVLVVSRLLTDEHQRRIGRPFAEDGLRRVLKEVAALTAGRRLL